MKQKPKTRWQKRVELESLARVRAHNAGKIVGSLIALDAAHDFLMEMATNYFSRGDDDQAFVLREMAKAMGGTRKDYHGGVLDKETIKLAGMKALGKK